MTGAVELEEGMFYVTVERGTAVEDALVDLVPGGLDYVLVGSTDYGDLTTYTILVARVS